MLNGKIILACGVALAVGLSGCSSDEGSGLNSWRPGTDAMRPSTVYSSALSCIRGLIKEQGLTGPGAQPISLTVGYLPDATGKILPGMRDMVTSAAAQIADNSSLFSLKEIASYGRVVGPVFGSKPETTGSLLGIAGVTQNDGYQIVGAVTQADEKNSDLGGSIGASNSRTGDAGFSPGMTVSTVGVDMRLVDVSKELAVVYTTRNLLRVSTTGRSGNINISIGTFGGNLSYSDTKSEGPHQAVRELVELSVAELLGQAAHVPYWSCMGVKNEDLKVRATIQGWWSGMGDEKKDVEIRARLSVAGYPVPAAPKSAVPQILQYQYDNHLVPTGKPDYETFASLILQQRPKDETGDMLHIPMVTPDTHSALRGARTSR